MKKYICFGVIIFLLFTSCIYRHTDDSKDLGNNYYFLPDGKMSTIYYNLANRGEPKKGREIVTPKVVNYSFNENYIIAKTIGIYDKKKDYWLIAKNKSTKASPLDSIKFYEELKSKGINLKFKKKDF